MSGARERQWVFCPECRRESVVDGENFIMDSKEAGR